MDDLWHRLTRRKNNQPDHEWIGVVLMLVCGLVLVADWIYIITIVFSGNE